MTTSRLPAGVEASALIRQAEAAGGFGLVLHKGEPDCGALLIVILDNQGFGQTFARAYERSPRADGRRSWNLSRTQDIEKKSEFDSYLSRRTAEDRDLWVIELTIADGEQFIRNLDNLENKPGSMG